MIKTVGELKKAIDSIPDDQQIVAICRDEKGTLILVGVDVWDEGVTLLCEQYKSDSEPPVYTAGFETSPSCLSMFAGPTPNLQEILECIPPYDAPGPVFIFLFKKESQSSEPTVRAIYLWNKETLKWEDYR